MTGGLMQLVAYGAQDIYLTGNPQITFFKVVYRRYTNFAIETIEHPVVGTPAFNNTVTTKITRNGDLISKLYVRVQLNQVNPSGANFAWVRRLGHALISQVEVDIGGTKIDRQYGTWLDVWYELARNGDHERGYANMIGDIPLLTNYDTTIKPAYTLYIPLQFWFNRFVGLAVPLIALQYNDITISIQFSPVTNLIVTDKRMNISAVTMNNASIIVNYIYLDTDERRRFALVGHEYLIEQLQFNGVESVVTDSATYVLDFNHPTKEFIWAIRNGNFNSGYEFLFYTNEKMWNITEAATAVLINSIVIGINPEPFVGGTWIEVLSGQSITVGTVNALNIANKNANSVFVNPDSVSYGTYGITNQINADVTIESDGTVDFNNIVTTLTIRDFSIPLQFATDTRYNPINPQVYIFSNYGLLIDGTVNPIQTGLIQFNGNDRFDQREGAYFNYVQPQQHHENTPNDGICVYSFALFPEQHQPSGTANLSRIESSTLMLTYADSTFTTGLPNLQYFNPTNQLFIYATNYNILRILSGLAGIAYGTP